MVPRGRGGGDALRCDPGSGVTIDTSYHGCGSETNKRKKGEKIKSVGLRDGPNKRGGPVYSTCVSTKKAARERGGRGAVETGEWQHLNQSFNGFEVWVLR